MKKEKIMVGMSGGVDSSVSAVLLMESGFSVTGVTLRLYDGERAETENTGTCCSLSDVEDAKAVCMRLGISHYAFNFKDKFEKTVINGFVDEYIRGGTPNPCIECNRHIKFSEMLDRALTLGFDKIATGHYAKVEQREDGRFLLLRGEDKNKDQSYVLYSMTQAQLSRTVFPLGGLTKPKVREIAEARGFVNAEKPDSQDICFVPDGDYAGFIERFTGEPSRHGNFVDENGNVIGEHKGIIRYTVGQRRGLGIAVGKHIYVLNKDAAENKVVLGDEDGLFYKRVLVERVNLIPFDKLEGEMRVTAKLRYKHREQPATLYPMDNGMVMLEFDEPQRAPSAGQAAVFYSGDIVVGGGTIVKGI